MKMGKIQIGLMMNKLWFENKVTKFQPTDLDLKEENNFLMIQNCNWKRLVDLFWDKLPENQ